MLGLGILAGITCLFFISPGHTDAAINPQINFQGKLTNPDGTNVTNGTYSIVFSIYTVASGGSAVWTETQGSVSVTDGIFQVALGSITTLPGSVDFNSSSLYLGIKVGADAEMTPRVQFTSTPYSFNSDRLDGIDSTGFVQLSPGSPQTGFINITGNATVGGTYNGNTFNSSTLTFSAASAATLQSAAGQALNHTGNAASTISTTAGNLTIQAGSGTVSLGSSTVLSSTGTLAINSGAATALTLDSGTTGAINLGTSANAKVITIGNITGATSITNNIGTGTSAFNIQGPSSDVYMRIDTTNDRLYVGNPAADGTAFLLILDYKNTTGDPTGVNGGEYYNSANSRFRCYQANIWQDCVSGFNTVTKTADQPANTSSTTMQNDNTLFFAVATNTTYVFDAWIPVNDSNTTADLKYTFTAPAASVLTVLTTYPTSATASTNCTITTSGTACANTTFNNANHFVQVRGYVATAGTAGQVRFQFAQNASNGNAFPVIKKGATLSWHQSN